MTPHTNFRGDVIPNMLPVGHNFYFPRACHLTDDLILLKSVEISPLERNMHGFQAELGGPRPVSHSDTWVWGRHVEHGCSAKLGTQLWRKNTTQYLDLLTEWTDLLGNKSLVLLHQGCIRTERWGRGVHLKHPNVLKTWAFISHVWPSSEHGEKQTQTQYSSPDSLQAFSGSCFPAFPACLQSGAMGGCETSQCWTQWAAVETDKKQNVFTINTQSPTGEFNVIWAFRLFLKHAQHPLIFLYHMYQIQLLIEGQFSLFSRWCSSSIYLQPQFNRDFNLHYEAL